MRHGARKSKAWGVVVALLASVTTTNAHAITGGWDATWTPSVVALVDDADGIACTGTLVAPRVVLTAAHCTSSGATRVLFGHDATDARATRIAIASFVTHPMFDAELRTFDVGLVALADRAPADIAPATLSREPITADLVGKDVALLGYGLDLGTGSAQRHGGLARVAVVASQTFLSVPDPSQPCLGDSGGPAFVNTESDAIVLGVVSSGDASCQDHATYSRVDAFEASFLDPMIAAMADGASAIGAHCFHPASCAGDDTCLVPEGHASLAYCTTTCEADEDCPTAMPCTDTAGTRLCRYATPPGTRGASCVTDSDCGSLTCARHGASAICAASCAPTGMACDAGYACTDAGASGAVCLPAAMTIATRLAPEPSAPSGGCEISTPTPRSYRGVAVLEVLAILGFAAIRRRVRD